MNNPFNFALFSERKSFFTAVLLQLMIFVLIVFMKFIFLGSGNYVVLEINSIDYKTTTGKEYVSIQYDISKINSNYGNDFKKGDPVYITLRELNGVWNESYYGITKGKPTNSVYIKGNITTVENSKNSGWSSSYNYNDYTIAYDIENFSSPIKKPEISSKLGYAIISLDKEGNAELKNIYINGKKWP